MAASLRVATDIRSLRIKDGAAASEASPKRVSTLSAADIVAVFALHDDRVASIGGFTRLAEAELEPGECDFHGYQTIRLDGPRKSRGSFRLPEGTRKGRQSAGRSRLESSH